MNKVTAIQTDSEVLSSCRVPYEYDLTKKADKTNIPRVHENTDPYKKLMQTEKCQLHSHYKIH
jgi:hypothetical protein